MLILDLVGLGLLIWAAFLWTPVIGLAVAGVSALAVANLLEPKVP